MKRMDGMTIGELARACDVSRDALRFYERERLLPHPHRTPGGYRIYRPEDASRVRFVRRAQAMGLVLDDIRELLELRWLKSPDQCRRVASRLETRVVAVERKIADLEAFRDELLKGLKRCQEAIKRKQCCPVVVELGASATGRK